MSADYMEALRVQLEVLRWLRARPGGTEHLREHLGSFATDLEQATPIFVADWAARAYRDASEALDESVAVTPEDLPCPVGFVLVNRPNAGQQDGSMVAGQVIARLWRADATHDGRLGVDITTITQTGPQRDFRGAVWEYGQPWTAVTNAETISDPDWEPDVLHGRTGLYALWAFMRERRVTTITHRGVDRALRKQADKAGWTHEPIVQMVELRASESRPHDADAEHQPVEWSCRWAVRGHWHKYHYGDGTLRARWLAPYVKGPGDKPLRAATKLLAVVR